MHKNPFYGGRDGDGDTVYTGTRPVDFATKKLLNVYLDEINTTNNFIDCEGSNLLACIGLHFILTGASKKKHIRHL